jgi:hypothetical protein
MQAIMRVDMRDPCCVRAKVCWMFDRIPEPPVMSQPTSTNITPYYSLMYYNVHACTCTCYTGC